MGFAASAGIWKQPIAILETIRDLDRQMNTEKLANFSFAKVRTFAVTGKLDQALYRLQQNDQIELSCNM